MLNDYFRDIRKLTAQLFANGRAFRIVRNSVKEKIFNALSISEGFFAKDADSILDHILPDNPNFTAYDALLWETRLGINSNPATDLEDRKAAIIQKLNHPGNILARQSADYIQQQLQLAGFNVYVHENPNELDPSTVFGLIYSGIAIHSPLIQHMQTGMVHGSTNLWHDVVANKIDPIQDQYFDAPGRTFFICGQSLGDFASIPEARKSEFRQLVLQLKRAKSVAYLAINYI